MTQNLKLVFTLSITLNLLSLGILGGYSIQRMIDTPMDIVQEELSPEGRHIMARSVQKAFQRNRTEMKKARKLKSDIQKILSADEFDADRFEIKAAEMQALMANIAKSRIGVTKELAENLPAKERKKLAQFFMKGFHGSGAREKNRKPHEFLKEFRGRDYRPRGSKTPEIRPELPGDMPPQPLQ